MFQRIFWCVKDGLDGRSEGSSRLSRSVQEDIRLYSGWKIRLRDVLEKVEALHNQYGDVT